MPSSDNPTWVDGSGGGTPIDAINLNNIETALTGSVAKTGDTLTGDLTFNRGANDSLQVVNTNATKVAAIRLQTAGVNRWSIGKSADAESGGSDGSYLDVLYFSDAGSPAIAMRGYRASGIVDFVQGVTSGGTLNASEDSIRLARTDWVRNTVTGRPATAATTSTLTTSDTYIVGKTIGAGELTTTSRFRIVVAMNKTATNTNTTITVRYGSAGTTADTSIFALALTGAGAVADLAIYQCEVMVNVINASTGQVTGIGTVSRGATATTGFHNQAGGSNGGSVASLDTTAARILGVSVQSSVTSVVSIFSATIQKICA